MAQNLISFKPFGGLGQIGNNMMLVSFQSTNLLIDCGIMFPNDDLFGLKYLLPDLSQLPNIDHLIITHAHEDHYGGISHLVNKNPNLKIWASPFIEDLIKNKIQNDTLFKNIKIYNHNDQINIKDMEIHPIHVNHSIPETRALIIRIKNKKFQALFASDFKIDPNPPFEPPVDLEKIAYLGKEDKVKICFADSTNINSNINISNSENDIIPALKKIIKKKVQRIFLTCFPSNIHRIQTIINISKESGRIVVPYGQAMEGFIQHAVKNNYLDLPKGVLKDIGKINLEKNVHSGPQMTILVSGCQGEFRGALRRIVTCEDSKFIPQSGDNFVFSSKVIPGNEKKVSYLINKLFSLGCEVYTNDDHLIHASGHANKEDLKTLYNTYSPTHAIPVHGETHCLHKHIDFIKKNFPKSRPILLLNNHLLQIDENLKIIHKKLPEESPLLIHGDSLPLDSKTIKQRRKACNNGIAFISIYHYGQQKSLDYIYDFWGIPQTSNFTINNFEEYLKKQLEKFDFKNIDSSRQELKISLGRNFKERLGYKPIIIIHINGKKVQI